MKMNPVTDSSFITGHSYDPETQTLRIRTKTGATYEHPGVPPQTYAAFTGAASPGQFYNKRIKSVHASAKVR